MSYLIVLLLDQLGTLVFLIHNQIVYHNFNIYLKY